MQCTGNRPAVKKDQEFLRVSNPLCGAGRPQAAISQGPAGPLHKKRSGEDTQRKKKSATIAAPVLPELSPAAYTLVNRETLHGNLLLPNPGLEQVGIFLYPSACRSVEAFPVLAAATLFFYSIFSVHPYANSGGHILCLVLHSRR